MTMTTEPTYCIHSDSACDQCQPADYADCYFCSRPTPMWIEDNDDSVGYRGRLYYCERCEGYLDRR